MTVSFEIPYFTVSGIQVRYLKIIEKSGYQVHKPTRKLPLLVLPSHRLPICFLLVLMQCPDTTSLASPVPERSASLFPSLPTRNCLPPLLALFPFASSSSVCVPHCASPLPAIPAPSRPCGPALATSNIRLPLNAGEVFGMLTGRLRAGTAVGEIHHPGWRLSDSVRRFQREGQQRQGQWPLLRPGHPRGVGERGVGDCHSLETP